MGISHIGVVYASDYGQAAKIARAMAERLRDLGHEVTLADVRALPPGFTLQSFDGVILGASVHFRRHQRVMRRFVRANRAPLDRMPAGFFSVSGAASGEDERSRADARRLLYEFLRQTDWHPAYADAIGGAMAYTRYSPPLRWITRFVSARAGGPTDTSRDHEFTDWAQVARFAERLAAMVQPTRHVRAVVNA